MLFCFPHILVYRIQTALYPFQLLCKWQIITDIQKWAKPFSYLLPFYTKIINTAWTFVMVNFMRLRCSHVKSADIQILLPQATYSIYCHHHLLFRSHPRVLFTAESFQLVIWNKLNENISGAECEKHNKEIPPWSSNITSVLMPASLL